MPRMHAAFLAALLAQGLPVGAQNSLDGLIDIPRPQADAPVFGPIDTIPMIDAPLAQPLGTPIPTPEPGAEGVPFFEFADEPATASPSAAPQVRWPGDLRTPADEEPPILGNGAIDHLLLTPEEAARADREAAAAPDESVYFMGQLGHRDTATLLEDPNAPSVPATQAFPAPPAIPTPFTPLETPPSTAAPAAPVVAAPVAMDQQASNDAELGALLQSFVPVVEDISADQASATGTPHPEDTDTTLPPVMRSVALPQDPTARFSFREAPRAPRLPEGPLLAVSPTSTVQGYSAPSAGPDGEWDAQAKGLPVARVDLPSGLGGVTLVLESPDPVFWGVSGAKGTRVDGVLLFGPAAPYASFAAKGAGKVAAPVVRRPDLSRAQAEQLVREMGGRPIAWK